MAEVERSVLLGKSRNRIDILATEIWFSDIVLKLVDFYGETKVSQKVRTVLPFCICRLCWFSKYVHILTFCHLLSVTTALWRGAGRHLYSHSVEESKTMRLGDLPRSERAPPGSWKLLITSPQPTDVQEGHFLAFTEKKTLVCFTFFSLSC